MEYVFDEGDESPASSPKEIAAGTLGNLGRFSCQTLGGFSEVISHPPADLMYGIVLGDRDESSATNTFTKLST